MATIIKATCQDCGDVDLTVEDVQVRVRVDQADGTYNFQCPTCLLRITKPAESRIVEVLVAAGVELVLWTMPAELSEPHTGAPIDHDDLIDFHLLLQEDSWFDRLALTTQTT